jgi:hypothetical protein
MSTKNNKSRFRHSFFALAGLAAVLIFSAAHGLTAASLPELGDLAPEGFKLSGPLQFYGTAENKLADGSIFDYMDGGGIVYNDHGFRRLVHREFSNPDKRLITFDCFTMETAAQALSALADERIAPEEGSPQPLGVPNKAYRFPPDYFIYMVKGANLIYLHVDDDNLAETLDRFAAGILKYPKEDKE